MAEMQLNSIIAENHGHPSLSRVLAPDEIAKFTNIYKFETKSSRVVPKSKFSHATFYPLVVVFGGSDILPVEATVDIYRFSQSCEPVWEARDVDCASGLKSITFGGAPGASRLFIVEDINAQTMLDLIDICGGEAARGCLLSLFDDFLDDRPSYNIGELGDFLQPLQPALERRKHVLLQFNSANEIVRANPEGNLIALAFSDLC